MSGASLSHLLPPLPGFTALARTYAPWPVWTGSTTQPVRFAAMPKKAAVRLWHRARDFDRGTHQPGHHGGAVGHTGLAVLHALIFDFLNHRTGRLDPSYAAIAAKAGVCVRTVAIGAAAAEGARDPELGAPLRRALGRRPVRAGAGDQRLRRAAGEPVARLPAATGAARTGAGHLGRSDRPCCQRSLRRRWRAIWRARCRRWPAIRRTAWRPPWRGSGGRSWPATREFSRSAADAEKPAPELNPTCNSRFGPADRRKEGALNKRRRESLCAEGAHGRRGSVAGGQR